MNSSSEVSKFTKESEHSLSEEYNHTAQIDEARRKEQTDEYESTKRKEKSDLLANYTSNVDKTKGSLRWNLEYFNPLEYSRNHEGREEQSSQASKDLSNPQNSPNISPVTSVQSQTERANFVGDLTRAVGLLQNVERRNVNPQERCYAGEANHICTSGIGDRDSPQNMSETNECELGSISEAETLPIHESFDTWRSFEPASSDESDPPSTKLDKRPLRTSNNDRLKLKQSSRESVSSDDTSNLLLLANTAESAKRRHLRSKTYKKELYLDEQPPRNDRGSLEVFNSASACSDIQPETPAFDDKLHHRQFHERSNLLTGSVTKRKLFPDGVQSLTDDFSSVTFQDMSPIVYTDDSTDESTQEAASKKVEASADTANPDKLSKIPSRFNFQQTPKRNRVQVESNMKRSLSAGNIAHLSKKFRKNIDSERACNETDSSRSSRRRKRDAGAFNLCIRQSNSSSPELKKQRSRFKKQINKSDSLNESD